MTFAVEPTFWTAFLQQTIDGLAFGALIALIALGYTMVYGIVELINFAHGDVFMLGGFLALTVLVLCGLEGLGVDQNRIKLDDLGLWAKAGLIALCLLLAMPFCGAINFGIDYMVYRPLRTAPRLAPLVSAIGVSFILMNVGLFWGGAQDVNFPKLVSDDNLLPADTGLRLTAKNAMVFGVTVPLMIALTLFVRFTKLGKAMRATAQNPTAARLMGINTDAVIGITFAIGGALAGAGAVVFALDVGTISYTMGFQNGLYAFTAAVLGGIGRIPGAVLGGLIIGLVRYYGSAYVGESWTGALIFGILIVILVFRPTGLLGSPTREKV
ncbi:MAG: branched-chain amino acid ABC transporter permease [Fimbriiglobus sp.]|jgi:branched-chain amino acid transport system permease protein|nr:branched-chain amino acid ABC transporter permease [Fimbriiglobus sp.]